MFRTRKCESCGKEFVLADEHLYKLLINHKTKYYCSYSCWRGAGGDGGRKHFTRKSNM